ncbi:MAG: hypothetical protein JJU37_06770 [Balneolaceae bacterium]|nr:hypothetical protein [Balneolaceae bacterium]
MYKKIITVLLLSFSLSLFQTNKSNAQSAELIGGNLLNGAVTGTALGVATMGLQNSSNFTPLRIGLGSGILAGAGLAIYDVATLPQGQQFFISGVFNDGTNSSVIILLDTFYGAVLGAALGSAVVLISNNALLDGLQYGTSAGAWVGFGFGLIDSFSLAERNRDYISGNLAGRSALFEVESNNTQINLIEPGLFGYNDFTGKSVDFKIQPTINLLTLRSVF